MFDALDAIQNRKPKDLKIVFRLRDGIESIPHEKLEFEGKVTSNLPTSIISNDASLHLKMMKYNDAVSITTSKLLRAMYPNDNDIIAKSYSPKTYCKFYLLRNKTVVNSNIDQATELIKSIVQKIIAD